MATTAPIGMSPPHPPDCGQPGAAPDRSPTWRVSMSSLASQFDLSGRTALVTGASSGLGVDFAHALAAAGANVVLAARRLDRLQALAADISAGGGNALAVTCDVTDEAQVAAAVAAAVETFGGLHIAVANAGAVPEGAAMPEKMPADLFRQSIDVNLTGTFVTATGAARHMLAHGGGSIIMLASVAGSGGQLQHPRRVRDRQGRDDPPGEVPRHALGRPRRPRQRDRPRVVPERDDRSGAGRPRIPRPHRAPDPDGTHRSAARAARDAAAAGLGRRAATSPARRSSSAAA